MDALRISLVNEPVRWANEFVAAGGVGYIFRKLRALHAKSK
jgi:hypothetical protein